MNEILSVLKLKDKITIIALMSVFALLLAGSAGAVAMLATNTPDISDGVIVDNHTHTYEYHIEKNADGDFDFIGECTVANCQNPTWVRYIESGITDKVKVAPTCYSAGERVYSFTSPEDNITYTYTEEIPPVAHSYIGEIVIDGDKASVNASCVTEGCTAAPISVSGVADLTFKYSDAATCNKPRRDYYTFTYGGKDYIVSTLVEEEGPHTLNGKLISEYEISDGIYLYGTPGIYTVDGITLVSCGQKTAGYYFCDGCNEPVGILVGTLPHSFEYSLDKVTKYPDFEQDGELQLDCTNEGCSYVEKIAIPKAVENGNAESLVIDEENKKETWKYTHTFEEYGFSIELEFETAWEHDHIFEYNPAKTKAPTIYRDGEFVVQCTLCEKEKVHTIPKPNEQNIDEIIEATEQNAKIYVYTYVSEVYGFTEVFEVEAAPRLEHAYQYELIPHNSGFALKGICNQPGCQETTIITDEGLVPDHKYVAPTCTNFGYESWSYTKDGQTYVFELPLPPDESNHTFVCDESNTVYPSFESAGTTVMKCSGANCGVKTETITLPIAVLEENARLNEESQTVIYTFVFTYNGIEFVGVAEYTLSGEHTHTYSYELMPMEGLIGQFDFVGSCTYPFCSAKVTESDVPATLVEDNSSCTGGIKQVWSYDYNGTTYYCYLDIWVPDGHHMDYVPNSPTTINPTLDESGSMEIFCTKCGETYILELPPINDPDVISEITKDTERQTSYSYIYHYVYNEFDPDGFLDIELIVLINK